MDEDNLTEQDIQAFQDQTAATIRLLQEYLVTLKGVKNE